MITEAGSERFDAVVSNADIHHTYARLYATTPAAAPARADVLFTPYIGVTFGGNADFGDVGTFDDPELQRLVEIRAADLVVYQNASYAKRYVANVREVAAAELLARLGSLEDDLELADALARWELALFEDEPARSEYLRESLAALLGGPDGLWAAAADAGLPLSFHIGHGTSQVKVAYMSWEMAAFAAVAPMQLDEPLAIMVFCGALERHPKLKLVLAECGIGWVPYFVGRMDQAAEKHVPKATDYQLKAKPSEIFRRHFRVAPYPEDDIPRIVEQLGFDDCIVMGTDYPHAEGLVEPRGFEKLLDPLSEDVKARILRTNAEDVFAPTV